MSKNKIKIEADNKIRSQRCDVMHVEKEIMYKNKIKVIL